MKERFTEVLLIVLCLLLLASLAGNFISTRPAGAEPPKDQIGRYQIAAWASYAGERVHHNGYYVLDTVTGKVVDKGHSVHGIEGIAPPE